MQDKCVTGRVSAQDEQHIFVAVDSENDCKGCGMQNVCSGKLIEFDKTELSSTYQIGQRVELSYEKVLQTSAMLYLIPVLFFFTGVIISRYALAIGNELVQFAIAIGATAAALFLIHIFSRSRTDDSYKVKIKSLKI